MRVRVFVTKPETRLSCPQGGSTQRPPPCCASPPRRGCAFAGAVVVGVSHTLSGARAPGWRCSATRRPAGPAGPAAAAAAGAQHAAPLASLPRRLAAVALRRCGGGGRESHIERRQGARLALFSHAASRRSCWPGCSGGSRGAARSAPRLAASPPRRGCASSVRWW